MKTVSLKAYAEQKRVSYEAVRQQVIRYKKELGNHIIRDGRQQFLDEEAVAFLDEKRQKNPVTVIQQDKNEQIEALEEQVKQLLMKTAAQADRIAELSEWKAEKAVDIAGAEQQKLLLEERTKRVEQLESTAREAEDKLRQAEKRTRQLEEEINRPLSFRERLTGKRRTQEMPRSCGAFLNLSKFFLKATWDFFRHVRAARWLLAVPEDHHAQLDDRERAPSQRRSQSSVWYVLCVLFHVPYFVDGAFRL